MTIKNRELSLEYFGILGAEDAPANLAPIAEATDAAMYAIFKVFKAAGLKFPYDDQCEAIEVAIYAAAKRVNAE